MGIFLASGNEGWDYKGLLRTWCSHRSQSQTLKTKNKAKGKLHLIVFLLMTNDTTDNKTHGKWSIENKKSQFFYQNPNKLVRQIFSPANLNLAKGKKRILTILISMGPCRQRFRRPTGVNPYLQPGLLRSPRFLSRGSLRANSIQLVMFILLTVYPAVGENFFSTLPSFSGWSNN